MMNECEAIPPFLPTGDGQTPLWVGTSPAMHQLARTIGALARTERTGALILGESGVGKEVVARALHHLSDRAARPFIPVNCGAIPVHLAEAELFGTERGGYTDARPRRGIVELAHHGTLFLDEVGELSPGVQRSLLRFLETRQYRRLGSEHIEVADVRVVAATLRDLAAAVRSGAFREDLLFRINVFVLTVPPLRERREDLPALVQLFLRSLTPSGAAPPDCTSAVIECFQTYDWPGNLRELRNVLERALVLGGGKTITIDQLPTGLRGRSRPPTTAPSPATLLAWLRLPDEGIALGTLVQQLEATLIAQALERTDGNQTRAAALLGITRDQLRHRRHRRE